jgi:hypothetical protein
MEHTGMKLHKWKASQKDPNALYVPTVCWYWYSDYAETNDPKEPEYWYHWLDKQLMDRFSTPHIPSL